MENNTKKGGFKEKTPDDVILKIVEMVEAKEKTQKQIAEELGVSLFTVYNYAKQFGLTKTIKTSNSKKPKKVTTTKKKLTIVTEKRSVVEAGMIGARHKLPVSKYIFGDVPNNMIFSFNKLENTIAQFLLDNITFIKGEGYDKIGKETLMVYVTGLSTVQTSIIKVCFALHVNLIFMHYNTDLNEYVPQLIWHQFNKNKVWELFPMSKSITLYKCSYEDIDNNDIYFIKIIDFDSKNKCMRDVDTIVCSNRNDMLEQYSEAIKQILINDNVKKSIFAYKGEVKNGVVINSEKINSISNFSTNQK